MVHDECRTMLLKQQAEIALLTEALAHMESRFVQMTDAATRNRIERDEARRQLADRDATTLLLRTLGCMILWGIDDPRANAEAQRLLTNALGEIEKGGE